MHYLYYGALYLLAGIAWAYLTRVRTPRSTGAETAAAIAWPFHAYYLFAVCLTAALTDNAFESERGHRADSEYEAAGFHKRVLLLRRYSPGHLAGMGLFWPLILPAVLFHRAYCALTT